jgi:hypothetical protein
MEAPGLPRATVARFGHLDRRLERSIETEDTPKCAKKWSLWKANNGGPYRNPDTSDNSIRTGVS